VIEAGVLVFNPAHVHLGDDVYIGHRTVLDGDTRGELMIGSGVWIGHSCYLSSAGGITIGRGTGIGAGVQMLTSVHSETPAGTPVMEGPLEFAAIEVGDGCDVGFGAILLPGARLGAGVIVGAGAVVKGEFPPDSVVAGVPARVIRQRPAS
jgi:acetyltransferase-like isoleucine patch superfamily enzyme